MSQSVEANAVETYLDNLSYLQKSQKPLYDKIVSFEKALEKGYYPQRYELEYKEEGYFDVKEIESGKYLYGADSGKYASKAAKIVNFRKDESVFETFYDYEITPEEIEEVSRYDISFNGMYATAEIAYHTSRVAPKEKTTMREIRKFVCMGIGLGTHIGSIHRKIRARTYLLVEDDLELFRLSLFVTNYRVLAEESTLFFSVFEDDDEARDTFTRFLNKSFYYNHYLKFFQMQSCKDDKMKILQTVIAEQPHLTFPFHSYFRVYLRPVAYLEEGYRFLNVSGSRKDLFDEKPVLIAAPGPSLGKKIDWLKKHQDKFVIVSPSAALPTLEKYDIRPDIIVHIESYEETCMTHFDNLESQDFIEDAVLICGSQAPRILLERFAKDRVFIYQNNVLYKKELGSLDPTCVGSATLMVLMRLGVRNLYLLGLDLALDSQTGVSHAGEHFRSRALDLSNAEKVEDVVAYLDTVIYTKGNFRESVPTTLTFNKSIRRIRDFCKNEKRTDQKIFNLGDGAFLEGARPVSTEELKMERFVAIGKSRYRTRLHRALIDRSSSELSYEDVVSIQKRIDHIQKVKRVLETSIAPAAFDPSGYQDALLRLMMKILDNREEEARDLHTINLVYLKNVLPFVFDMLNTREFSEPKKNIKKIHKLLIRYLTEIVEYYEKPMKRFIASPKARRLLEEEETTAAVS